MFKFLLFVGSIIAFSGFTPIGQNLTHRAIDVVNPASAERKALSELEKRLETISDTINSKDFAVASTADKTKQLNQLLGGIQNSLEIAQEKAEDGDLTATISSLIKKVTPENSANSCPEPTHTFK